MPRFAANLSMLFTELPFLDRFQAAADAGFDAVEYLFPYDHAPEVIAERLRDADVEQVLFNAPPGDWASGERGLASLPDRDDEFDVGITRALRYAEALNCPRIHVMAGIPRDHSQGRSAPGGVQDLGHQRHHADPTRPHELYTRRIRHAADRAAQAGRRVLIEPINSIDMPGYWLSSVAQALTLLEEIDHPALGLQLDIYHAQITEGDITRLIRRAAPVTEHVQIASVPDRYEPTTGELDDAHVFSVLDHLGYTGWVGCEYRPAGETTAGLEWFQPYRGSRP